MKVLFLSTISMILFIGCFPSNPNLRVSEPYYEKYYLDQIDEGSKMLKAFYHYTIEQTKDLNFVKKTYFPETKTLTNYETFTDKSLTKKTGPAKTWSDNGSLSTEGNYYNGLMTGEWKFYSRTKSKKNYLSNFGDYKYDKRIGIWTSLDSLGNKSAIYNYSNNNKNGAFERYNKQGEITEKGKYIDNKIDSTTLVIFTNEKPNKLPVKPNEKYKVVERMPMFKNAECEALSDYKEQKKCSDRKMLEYIYRNIKYPPKARNNYVQGITVIRFVVAKDGSINDVECIKCICQPMKDEVERLVKSFPDWNPGMQRDEPVDVYFNLPIKFRLE